MTAVHLFDTIIRSVAPPVATTNVMILARVSEPVPLALNRGCAA